MALPNSQTAFFDWQDNFMTLVLGNLVPWAINADQWAALLLLRDTYVAAYKVGKKGNKANRTPTQTKAKTDAEKEFQSNQFGLENFIANNIAKNPKIKDSQRLSLGTTIYKKKYAKIGKPETVPENSYAAGNAQTVKGSYRQQPDTLGVSKRGKPKGSKSVLYAIFVAVLLPPDAKGNQVPATPPIDPDDFGRFETTTRSPVLLLFKPSQSGLMASFASCWVTATGIKGDWSTIQTFRIP